MEKIKPSKKAGAIPAAMSVIWMALVLVLFVWGFVAPKLWPGHGGVW